MNTQKFTKCSAQHKIYKNGCDLLFQTRHKDIEVF